MLGGVKGGKVVALNARSLDILNGKFDEPSRKFALRPNPRAAEGQSFSNDFSVQKLDSFYEIYARSFFFSEWLPMLTGIV